MNETKKRREWIKNAAIIFLAVLLVLTFFSGTIQNHSLPEVAVQYTTSDTVSSGVRVSGTVNASQSYSVTLDQTRTVRAVYVRNGDEVAAGDPVATIEAMKMEAAITTPVGGTVERLAIGGHHQQVEGGDLILVVAPG